MLSESWSYGDIIAISTVIFQPCTSSSALKLSSALAFPQVRFVFELFRGMQPGMPLTALHGKIKQDRRTMVFQDFIR